MELNAPNGAAGPPVPSGLATEPSISREDPATAQAVEEYRAMLRDGIRPDREEFLARHPETAAVLIECLDALEFIHAAASRLQAPVSQLPAGASPAADIEPEAPLGDFRIVREVGRGGMGIVYEAVQFSLGRRVALKVLPFAAGLDARQLQRFKTEAQAAARLHHTNIVPVHAVGCERGTHFYAMQFIDGQTLAAVITDLRRFAGIETPAPPAPTPDLGRRDVDLPASHPPAAAAEPTRPAAVLSTERSIRSPGFFRTAARLGLQAAEALDYAHRQEIIHRDIKPANLLVDDEGNLWITDFGLARLQGDAGLTGTGDLLGTLRYMSPEQALGKRMLVDHRTDIYSLGATLYELLTLERAVPGSDRQEVLRRIERDEPRRPRRLNPAIPPELETILLKAIAKDPDQRYATAHELADDLRRFLEDKPIQARRPTLRQVTAKWARRHRGVVVTAALAVLVGLGLGVTGLVISNLRIREEKAQAEADRRRADRNRSLAMDALDRIYLRVAEQRFVRASQLRPEDRELLVLALGFYQQLARENDNDPAVRQAVADAYFRVGDIQRILGQPGLAKEAYERGQTSREQLVAESPTDYACRSALAEGHRRLALVRGNLGDRSEELSHHEQALELALRLTADFPHVQQACQMVARSHTDLGMFQAVNGAWAAAEDQHRQAMTLRAQLAADFPTEIGYREDLANSHWNLGNVLAETGRSAEAETQFHKALEIQARLAADHPTVPQYRQEEALSACNLAILLARQNPNAAQPYYQRALDLRSRLAADFPAIPQYRSELAEVHDKLGILLSGMQKQADAVQHFQRALELCSKLAADFPNELRYRKGLATVHGNLGCALLTKEPAAAKKYLGEAIDVMERLAVAEAAVTSHRRGLAHAHHNLGVLLDSTGDWAEAEAHFRRAVELWTRLTDEVPTTDYFRYYLARNHQRLACLLHARGKRAEGTTHFNRALTLWLPFGAAPLPEGANPAEGADMLEGLAFLFASCPELSLRDADRAVFLARKATACAPQRDKYWSTLGLTYYRAGDLGAARDALHRASQLGGSQEAANAFLLAMIHGRLADKHQARRLFDEADRLMATGPSKSEYLRRLRAEAAGVAGVAKSSAERLSD
jgi:serine/threonine protein kinase/Flp pilus assembly protein TadD